MINGYCNIKNLVDKALSNDFYPGIYKEALSIIKLNKILVADITIDNVTYKNTLTGANIGELITLTSNPISVFDTAITILVIIIRPDDSIIIRYYNAEIL